MEVFKNDFREDDQAMFQGVERINELLFCILRIEKKDFDNVT
jgi:hypothetical protein